jgi:hypothetical protein
VVFFCGQVRVNFELILFFSITEELEEIRKQTVYQDYKFITFNELEELELSDLIGSDLLRPHMHGILDFYFIF